MGSADRIYNTVAPKTCLQFLTSQGKTKALVCECHIKQLNKYDSYQIYQSSKITGVPTCSNY